MKLALLFAARSMPAALLGLLLAACGSESADGGGSGVGQGGQQGEGGEAGNGGVGGGDVGAGGGGAHNPGERDPSLQSADGFTTAGSSRVLSALTSGEEGDFFVATSTARDGNGQAVDMFYDGERVGPVVKILADGLRDGFFDTSSSFTEVVFVTDVFFTHARGLAIVGDFTLPSGTKQLAVLDAGGGELAEYRPGALFDDFDSLLTVTEDQDGRLLVGGSLLLQSVAPVDFSYRNVVRLNVDATLDTTFDPGAFDGAVGDIEVDGEGRIWVAGNFTQIGGTPSTLVAILGEDGTVVQAFDGLSKDDSVSFAGAIDIALQPDGKAIVVGNIRWEADDGPQHDIVRLSPDGSIDTTFRSADQNADASFLAKVALDTRGNVYVGTSGGVLLASPYVAAGVQMLLPSGEPHPDFFIPEGTEDQVVNIGDIMIDAEDRPLMVGDFGGWGGVTVNGIVRMVGARP